MLRSAFIVSVMALFAAIPAVAQELPNEGQSEAAYVALVQGKPHFAAEVAQFEEWQRRKGVAGILPTWQLLRTATMWRECRGPAFQVPPRKYWENVAATLRFVRDQAVPAMGPLQAVSGYRNPGLNQCARGSPTSAHRDYSAVDLVPMKPLTRRLIFDRICPVHRRAGRREGVGLGFYAFRRFHIDTRSFRRWGSAGSRGNESPCAVLERGGDPEAPRLHALSPEVPPASPIAPPIAPNR